MILYAAIATRVVMLTDAAEGKAGDANKRRLLACVDLGLFAFSFSLILSIFMGKASGYPSSFLLK